MTEYAAIQASFANIRIIQGRKVLQLVFEVPVEDAPKITAALGWPNPAEPARCAIAKLKPERTLGEMLKSGTNNESI